jgi:heme/copper-type cytochrome/quinol oxidase subunit 2
MNRMHQPGVAIFSALAGVVLALVGLSAVVRAQQPREFSMTADQFAFAPDRIEVERDSLVKITFTAKDMPHSFTIDDYRISKRAGAGQTVVFEFHADKPGPHDIICNLSQDDRCRRMKAQLVVK